MKINYSVPKLQSLVEGKRVLFITTKNSDYLRNVQEIRILKKYSNEVEIMYSNKKNNPLRIIDVWNKLLKTKVSNFDIIFIGFEPQFVLPFFRRRFKDKIVVIDFFISVYDTLVCDRKIIRDGLLLSKLCYWLDEITIKNAVLVITDTKAHRDFFVETFGVRLEKCEVLYLEADTSVYYPRPQNKPEKLKNKFIVLYFGSILPLQGVDIVLGAIKELRDRNDIYFDIIGPIPEKYNKPIQDNVNYINWLSQEELAEHIANADLCLAGHFHKNIDKAKRTIPGKAYIYEMMEKKMILGETLANRELFCDNEMHFFVEQGNVKELNNIICKILSHYK